MVRWTWRQRLFAIISRSCIALYGRLPIFGALRGSAAIIRRENSFLVLERSDGLGLAFPGGMVHPWESEEQGLAREVREETGLRLTRCSFLLRIPAQFPTAPGLQYTWPKPKESCAPPGKAFHAGLIFSS